MLFWLLSGILVDFFSLIDFVLDSCTVLQVPDNAAIHLGGPWLRRAEAALKFYMQSPGSLGTANGTLSGEGDNQAATYQLLALHRYWVATRDDAFVSKVWPTCSGALAHMISSFDPNATGVLGAPNHLNAFLYLLRFQRHSELTDH